MCRSSAPCSPLHCLVEVLLCVDLAALTSHLASSQLLQGYDEWTLPSRGRGCGHCVCVRTQDVNSNLIPE
ncbi:hypothetical protein Q5P01_014958 [Channa striata]|uniref:Secreted protein n=1 Tax=Channa striata TaxID=64152 RepID=A0AA88MH12_CHASR|nr:hypothetical protein Q5P01_014958 [Channa striata]